MCKKPKELKVTVVEYADFVSMYDGCYPSKFVYRDAFGNYNFIHTNKRSVAEAYVKEISGGIYSIREV
jgi:hypothetical protein